jgi:hypothetical protein
MNAFVQNLLKRLQNRRALWLRLPGLGMPAPRFLLMAEPATEES